MRLAIGSSPERFYLRSARTAGRENWWYDPNAGEGRTSGRPGEPGGSWSGNRGAEA
jgi:hypothetical protein